MVLIRRAVWKLAAGYSLFFDIFYCCEMFVPNFSAK